MSGTLYVVGTPIGNLADITHRAMDVLRSVDIVIAEDTRQTKKLLDHINSDVETISYHHHSSDEKKFKILKMLMDGEDLALVTDAGTPGISDPGNELIDFILENSPEQKVVPIPGISAVSTAISICGFDTNHFTFLGFLPKKKLLKTLKEAKSSKVAIVYFDSPYRVLKNLEKFAEILDGENSRVMIARELTKIHETVYRGDILDVIKALENEKSIKGEVVVVVEKADARKRN